MLTEQFGPLEGLPVRVEVKHGRAERDTLPLLEQWNAWGHPILAIFDSWGHVGVPWDHIRTIAENPSSEAIVTFGGNWFSRRQQEDPHKLNEVFGGAEHWSKSDPDYVARRTVAHVAGDVPRDLTPRRISTSPCSFRSSREQASRST